MIKVLFHVILCSILMADTGWAACTPFVPKDGKLLVIGQQRDAMDGYVRGVGIVPGGFMFYTSIQRMDGLDKPAEHGAGTIDAQYYIKHYPNTVIQLALYMVGELQDTLEGHYDDQILKLAQWIKKIERPVYLRIGYEFDLPDNAYDPQLYKQVYRYIVDHLRWQGVENVAYVWHSDCRTEPPDHFMDWYPGDDYVDWFAISLFNPIQIATARRFAALAREHKKPLMIAESSPAGLYSTRARTEWFRHYFDFIHDDDVKIVCYINSNWNSYPLFQSQDWGDGRIQEDAVIKEMWLKEISTGYLQSSPQLFKELTGQCP